MIQSATVPRETIDRVVAELRMPGSHQSARRDVSQTAGSSSAADGGYRLKCTRASRVFG
jgi:hypothetical protein